MTSTGRPARIVCVALAVLSLVGAVVLLTDAVGTDDPEQAARLAALAPVLAMGSIMWMLGALVATAAATASRPAPRETSGVAPSGQYAPVQQQQFAAHQQPQFPAHQQPQYTQAPPFVPPPTQQH